MYFLKRDKQYFESPSRKSPAICSVEPRQPASSTRCSSISREAHLNEGQPLSTALQQVTLGLCDTYKKSAVNATGCWLPVSPWTAPLSQDWKGEPLCAFQCALKDRGQGRPSKPLTNKA